ncbi:lipid-A-disaccharide synthase [Brevundimonas sp. 2R-24]|uniref:Lipid-A-disaccharide synthase n=1 Tax=Peiella sedimenti TaxID=3061083 RepID=A0ABT8SN12_9CAUL|nr:lipid-A-disaccharide synthase [Caulobacteraceae bacterium XZ-24]
MGRSAIAGLKIMLVAAETSGDALGAGLARALKARLGPRLTLVGVGGARMAEEGVNSPFDITELSILGWVEGLMAYGRVKRRVKEAAALARAERPDAVVLIDSWGFTIRVAKAIRAEAPDIPLIKYVGPQVWASRPGRARTLAGAVDHLLALHAMDRPWFEAAGLPTTVVGSQALHLDFSDVDAAAFRRAHGLGADQGLLIVLPGSRPSEISRLMDVFGATVGRLKAERPDLAVVMPVAESVAEAVAEGLKSWPVQPILIRDEADKMAAMKAATAALACSGTVSIELALAGTPMVIAYRLGGLSYALMKRLVTARYITLFNIAADRMIAPELIQNEATAGKLAAAVGRLLDDPAAAQAQAEAQVQALDLMGRGGPDPSEAAAEAVLKVLEARRAA